MWKQGTHPPHTPWEASCVPDTKPPGPCLPAQPGAPVRFEGRPSALRPRPPLSSPLFSRGGRGWGPEQPAGQPSFFRPFGGFLAGPALHICPLVPGMQRALLSSGAACRAVGERGVQGGHGGGGRRAALLPRVLWGAYRWATQDAEAEPPLWEGPRYGLLSRAGGNFRARLVPVGTRSPERGRSLPRVCGQPAAEPDLRPEPWSPREPALGEDPTNRRHRGPFRAEAGSRPSSSPPECWVTRGQGPALRAAVSPSAGRGQGRTR